MLKLLKELGDLKTSGIRTEEEFTKKKKNFYLNYKPNAKM